LVNSFFIARPSPLDAERTCWSSEDSAYRRKTFG
jgi:hypothetical protein